jgi:hypothetical protein
MIIKLKKGVSVKGIKPEMAIAVPIIAGVWEQFGVGELVITSACDGKHSEGSLHYRGYAFDLRIWSFKKDELESVKEALCMALNGVPDNSSGDWDVCLEKTHIHLEFDPS